DYDGDNYGNPVNAISSCEDTLVGYVLNNLDCNDSNFVINPDGIEICNDLDDDCNTLYDEGFALNVFYADADGDGFGNNAIFIVSCLTEFPGYVELGNDCNDTSFVINPDAIEMCNGLDDNCNLAVDEGFPMNTVYFDADGDLFGDQENDTTTCTAAIDGFIIDSTDCDDANSLIFPGAEELFNGIDDNCNQLIDEGVAVNTIITMPFNVFPNPANNELFISFQIPVNGNVALYDLMGNLVLIKPIVEINFIKIDIALLASGNYFLQFTSNAGSEFLGIIQKE
ncbi:MAG: MopE-related protein, partial [Chitinophagales bacterium]